MIDPHKYNTAKDFRQALDAKLRSLVILEGKSLEDLRRQVVFNRFLARLDFNKFVLTGGYSLELRLPLSRSTTDIDLYLRDRELVGDTQEEQNQAVLLILREQSEKDLQDYFSFVVERVLGRLHGPKEGGVRCLVEARLNNKEYYKFHVDIAICPFEALEPERVSAPSMLSFSETSPITILVLQKEELFVNKIHAYTRIRTSENSRVEDLVDMALLVDAGLNAEKTLSAIRAVFSDSDLHNEIPSKLPPRPAGWREDFHLIAERRNLDLTMPGAFKRVEQYYSSLFKGI